MKKITIVVPLDGSPFAETAMPSAIRMAKKFGTSLTLASVYNDEPLVAGYPLNADELRANLITYLDAVSDRITDVADIEVETAVLSGSVTKTLIEFVQRTQPAMVVMSTHGRGPVSRFWLGSVADRVLRYVTMPVLLVRPSDTVTGPVDFAKDVSYHKILIPLDGSDRAEESLAWAQKMATAEDPEFVALRGVSIPTIASPYLPHTVQENQHALTLDRDEADAYLDILVGRLAKEGMNVTPMVDTAHNAAASIIHAIDDLNVDLTVITTHGRSGLARTLFGSVADKVIRGASGPVLVVRTVHSAREFDEALVSEVAVDVA